MARRSRTHGLALAVWAILVATNLVPAFHAQVRKPPTKPNAAASFKIAGTAVSAMTSEPMSRAQVSVTNTNDPKDTQSLVTGDDGRFQFQVSKGKYSLQGAKRGFVASAYEQHENFWTGIVTGAGLDTENLILRLPPAAAITGKILDDVGEPVRNAGVTIYREDHSSGVSRILAVSGVATDDLGTYEVTPLNAGTYYAAVGAQPWYAVHPASSLTAGSTSVDRALDAAFPVTYFKDATGPDDAVPIPLHPGDHVEADFHLGAVPALRLVFRSTDAKLTRPILQQPSFDEAQIPQEGSMEQISPGVYEIAGLAPGKYSLLTTGPNQRVAKTHADIFLNTDGQELDPSDGTATASVRAKVHLRGADKLPVGLTVILRDAKGTNAGTSAIDEKGEADFAGLEPGDYEVVAFSPAKIYSVFRITSGEQTQPGHSLTVAAGSSHSVSLDLIGGSVTIEGFAKKSGKAASAAMVVLVPQNPEANLELFRRDQSDLDGSFALRQIIPGTYTILAIEDGWDLDWAKPAVIEHYRQHGQKVLIGDQKETVRLPNPVEVQPKL